MPTVRMTPLFDRGARYLIAFLVVSAWLMGLVGGAIAQSTDARATDDPAKDVPALETAALPPYKLGVLVSSDADRCYNPGIVKAIRAFSEKEIAEINAAGGIHERQVELQVFDDYEDKTKTLEHLKSALDDPNMLGFVGIGSSTRGHFVFELLGKQIASSSLPIVTDISLGQIYEPYPSVFSMASAVDDELDVVRTFLKDNGFSRPAFVGVDGDLYSASLGNGLARDDSAPPLVVDRRVVVKNYAMEPAAVGPVVKDIMDANADVVILAIHSGPGAEVLKNLTAAGAKIPIFVLYGRSSTTIRRAGELPAGLRFFQLGRDGVPYVYNERLRQRIWQSGKEGWIFNDTPNLDFNEGWAEGGRCKKTKIGPARRIFDASNRRAVGRGMQFRDMLHLIASRAKEAPAGLEIVDLRKRIASDLRSYVEGEKVYQGLWQDWTFTSRRAAASDILVTTTLSDTRTAVLAPNQYRRVNGELVKSPVVDISIDLIRLSRIDSNERRFDADFYLSLKSRDEPVSIDTIDFTNAERSPIGDKRLITSDVIHDGGEGSKFPRNVRVYKVSGTFQFNPDLETYPFDTQRLSVSFQARKVARPIYIQPLAQDLRRSGGDVDGWRLRDEYVGSQQDFISTIAANGTARHLVPIHKFNQTWVAQRISIDYYIRVVVPLGFILLVTYFSVYLPPSRFDSTVAIQVTALLSSIALYLALPKVDSDQATLSDRMFIMTYAAVALMIGLTILKDSVWLGKVKPLRYVVGGAQKIAFPVATVVASLQLIALADRDGASMWVVLQKLRDSVLG